MKRRIEQLISGKFEYDLGQVKINPAEICRKAEPDAVVSGNFWVSGENEQKVRGFIYTSSPRVICSQTEFQGIDNEIHYQIDCSGLAKGAVLEEKITICCEQGEFSIPCQVTVSDTEKETHILSFQSMHDFALLAEKDFQKAYRCFVSEAFRQFLKEKETDWLSLYDAITGSELSYQSLEEFLTGAGLKEELHLSVSCSEFALEKITGPMQETVVLSRNTWGFGKISVSADARFLRPEKKLITTDEFAGSNYDLRVVIDTNLMHAGKNYANLSLVSGHQTIQIPFVVSRTTDTLAHRQNHTRKIMIREMEKLYVKFRLKKIDISTWIERSVSVINSYRRADGKDVFADLFLVQLYFADGKKQKALKLLESLENQKNRFSTPERYGFYLYMSTFFYQEASYVDRVEEEISRLFYRDKTNWKLLWILLYLQESYLKDENARYEAVAEQFRYGCRSRIMYLEAYQILKNNPFLMRHLGAFELKLLSFAAKEEILTAEVIRQAAGLAQHYNTFNRQLFEILERGYEMYPSADLVKAICLLLMRGNKNNPVYYEWYSKGVECGLRLNGLYEYYMETMEEQELSAMPQVIRMYFAYDTSLDYEKRALIYRRIIENKETDRQIYHNYRGAIERFALDQLEEEHISDDLAVIYNTFLRKNALTKNSAEKLARMLFTYEIFCLDPKMKKAVVYSSRMQEIQTVVLKDGKALVCIYDPDSVIVLENESGSRYQSDSVITVRPVFENEKMLSWTMEKAGDYAGLLLHYCIRYIKEKRYTKQTMEYLRSACEKKEYSDEFREELRGIALHYYMEHLRDSSLPEFLEQIPYLEYVKTDKTALITLLAEEGRCAEAFSLLDAYGAEGIALLQLVRICSRMVLELEFAENHMLVSLCHHCFASGKYDDKLLRYLLLYFEGPVQEMKQVWQAAVKFDLDTMLLEEKIITLILFTGNGSQGSESIFESYVKKMGRKKLCKAYVNLKAYEYFVKGLPVSDPVFQYIEREYQYLAKRDRLAEQALVCRLALLQYYSKTVTLNSVQKEIAASLLEECSDAGLRFGFWQYFDRELIAPYQMEGHVFAEYVCAPDSTVTIYYRIRGREEEYTQETVHNYFGGIFVREFTLFEGEELECYLEEQKGEETIRTDNRILKPQKSEPGLLTGYELLNRISRIREAGDEALLREELENYLTLEHFSKTVFTLM